MALLGLELDLSGLASLLTIGRTLNQEAASAARDLTAMAHGKATELANARLHSRRQLFLDSLHVGQVENGTWFLQLDARAAWIEDGMPPHDMLPGLLASPKAKTTKDGHRYVVVPFRHGPAQAAPASSQPMVQAVRQAMRQRGIPWAKVERDAGGRALAGRLHSFDVDAPLKTADGPGQGWGTVGDVRQGPNDRQRQGGGPAGGGTPFLSKVSVYQRGGAGGTTRRDIVTFRIASDSQRDTGMWFHPGLEGSHVLDATYQWVVQTWEKQILPAMMERIIGG